MKVMSFKVDEELLHKITELAVRKGMSRSEVIREAVIKYLECEGVHNKQWIRIKTYVLR